MANTSVGPAVTSANLPKSVQPVVAKTVAAAIDDIVAAPLVSPNFTNGIKPKNPDVSFRWILHTLYKGDGTQSSLRFEQAKLQGFAVATESDLADPSVLAPYRAENGTKYINGDLILMKIPRKKYEGALLYRDQKTAKQVLAATGKKSRADVEDIVRGTAASGKVAVYDPTQGELQEFIQDAASKGAAPLGGE